MFRIPLKFRWIYKHLSSSELSNDCSFDLCLSDLFGEQQRRFLDYYSEQGLRLALKRYGLVAKLRELGYEQVDLKYGVRDDGSHFLVVFEPPFREENKIGEFIARKTRFEEIYPCMKVEWLCLQNPRKAFTEEKPRLPGQRYPGLGLGRDVLSMIMLMAIRLKYEALVNVADHFHNAYIYANSFYFHRPEDAGCLRALAAFMADSGLSLAQMAWALEQSRIFEAGAEKAFHWEASPQILPLRSALEARYQDPSYGESVRKAKEGFRFVLKGSPDDIEMA